MLWGNITNYWNAEGATTIPAEGILLDRGYTGHEHLLSVGLINMNARLYDPVLHRFLQPDNYVQDPFNTQNLGDIVIHNQTFKIGEITTQISDAFISNYEEIISDRTKSPIIESRSKRALITFNNLKQHT